jgi:hypothetical protein
MLGRVAKDRGADRRYPGDQGRNIIAEGHLRLGHGRDDLIGKIIDEAYEEVARPHGGVADFEFKKPLGRINPGKGSKAAVFGLVVRFKLARLRRECLHPRHRERIDVPPDTTERSKISLLEDNSLETGTGNLIAQNREFIETSREFSASLQGIVASSRQRQREGCERLCNEPE